jgi:DnaA family protein
VSSQLPLALKLGKHVDFASFYQGENAQLVAHLRALSGSEQFQSVFIWGLKGCGKTHLLQSLCQLAAQTKQSPIYLDCKELVKLSPALFEGLEQLPILCIDDVDLLLGHREWEEAMFHLYNRCQQLGHSIVWSASQNPGLLNFEIADLGSRLTGGSQRYHVRSLTDAEKLTALQKQAQHRGFELADNVARYLLTHFSRDMRNLCAMLDELDEATLAAQRKLTIPFLKQWLLETSA